MSDTIQAFIDAFQNPFGLPGNLPDVSALPKDGPTVVIFAPHPDDECTIGALPLRLRREANARVINLSVTLGSNEARRTERIKELEAACSVLSFELEVLNYVAVTPATRANDRQTWDGWVADIAKILARLQPDVVIAPHAEDHHPAHIGVYHLMDDALAKLAADQPGFPQPARCLTEFWHPMKNPNLMLEVSKENLAILLKALCCHVGEVARNPYHLRMCPWMMDNTRRGAELIGGFGSSAVPPFVFSTLYRWEGGDQAFSIPVIVSEDESLLIGK